MNRYTVTIKAVVGDMPVEMTMSFDEKSERRAEELGRLAFQTLLERPIGNSVIESATVRDARPAWNVDVLYNYTNRSGTSVMAVATYTIHADDAYTAQQNAMNHFAKARKGCVPRSVNVVPA